MSNIVADPRPARPILAMIGASIVALLLQLFCWGFTVDDAWIVSRVASHGARGLGFSFNPGQVTDAVTPLGYERLLSLAAYGGARTPLDFFWVARILGCACYGIAFVVAAGAAAKHLKPGQWWLPGAALSLCIPSAVWAGAGLEGPMVGLWILWGALLCERSSRKSAPAGALLLGMSAAWRPELAPATLGILLLSKSGTNVHRRRLVEGACFCLPLLSVALARELLFSSVLPLSFAAKPAAFDFGLRYVLVTAIWGGLPWLILTIKWQACKELRWPFVLLVHGGALLFSGGDWMPALRLSAPLLPWLLWRLVPALPVHMRGLKLLLLAPAIYGPAMMLWSQGSDFRHVTSRRLEVVQNAKPLLLASRVVAGVDVGWLGLAFDGEIVDLAGVSDPVIAKLPGGHTSKNISPGLFSGREVDTWVIRAFDREYQVGAPLESIQAVYLVDARLLQKNADLGFVGVGTVPLPGTGEQYIVARHQDPRVAKNGSYFRTKTGGMLDSPMTPFP